MKPEPKKKLPN